MNEVLKRLKTPGAEIAAFCERWGIARLEVFGSVLREDFDQESDIDLLVTFAPQHEPKLVDLLSMESELRAMLGRDVDLVKRQLVEESPNWVRRRHILDTAQLLYAAA